jgi:hypothetical protein
MMLDTNTPYISPEDLELDAYFQAQDELIQEMIDRGELGEVVCAYPVYDIDRFIFEEPKESLLKRLFSFLFR